MALDGLPLAANPFELFEVPMVSGPDSVTIRAPLSPHSRKFCSVAGGHE
jgi:hypothetical protein